MEELKRGRGSLELLVPVVVAGVPYPPLNLVGLLRVRFVRVALVLVVRPVLLKRLRGRP